jgi:hypothetical protein
MVANTSSRVTTDHDAIRRWAEERGAKPVLAARSACKSASVRLEFPGSRDTTLREIGWDEWFQRFDKGKLALLYQQQTADGEHSNFCEIVPCQKADEVEQALGGRGRSATRRGKPRESKSVRLHPASEAARSSPAKTTLRTAGLGKIAPKTTRRRKPGPASRPGETMGLN